MGLGMIGRRAAAACAGLSLALLAAAGCTTAVSVPEDDVITLKVDIFSDQGFGYEGLYEEYQKSHPNIRIKERGKGDGLSGYNVRLAQWMKSGAGAGDVVALEEGTIVQFKAQADRFHNLFDHGLGAAKSEFIDWKWEQGLSADGKQLLGLGTDVGSMAICYRKDLFARAGLPTDREAVGALWPDWNGYLATGRRFVAASPGVGFLDSSVNVFTIMMMQTAAETSGYTFYDKTDKLVVSSNPAVRSAWDFTVTMIDSRLSAKLASWSEGWVNGFKQAQFATIACPSWMTGVIKGNAGESAAGKWDVARAPGSGGNWGGSFLAVPKQAKHPKEAAELVRFLTSAQGQISAFKVTGGLPSNLNALKDPAITGAKNEYFSGAATGAIFGAGALSLKPVYFGPKNQSVRDAVEAALRDVELGKSTSDAAWQKAIADAAKVDSAQPGK